MEIKEELGAFDDEVPGVWEMACIESEWTELERPFSTHNGVNGQSISSMSEM